MELNFLPVALILRTVVTDIIVHRYLRTIFGIAGVAGVEQELNVIDCDFARAMKKIFKVLSVANPGEEKNVDAHFIASYSGYLKPDGSVVDPKSLRVDTDIESKIASYKTRQGIHAPNTDKEGGKIDFLADANRENLKYLYTYLAQFHHYTTRSSTFYKDPDFRRENIKVCGALIWLATSMMFGVYTDLFPALKAKDELKALAEAMVGEEIPLSSRL